MQKFHSSRCPRCLIVSPLFWYYLLESTTIYVFYRSPTKYMQGRNRPHVFFIWPIFIQDWPLQQGWYQLHGGKTFCPIFCASFIAGSRRAFLWLCSTVCLFVTDRVLTKTEWNAQGVNVCSSKSLFTFVWFLFFVTWKLPWTRNNQC